MDGLRAGRSGFNFEKGARDFSLLQIVHTGSGDHWTSYQMGTEVFPRVGRVPGVKLTTHFHLVTSARIVEPYLLFLVSFRGVELN
jgi:hypothetical protein